jgi:NhaA family Na+:H+ antiporter
LLAFFIPAKPKIEKNKFYDDTLNLLNKFSNAEDKESILRDEERLEIVFQIEKYCEKVLTPLQRLEHLLHPWVTFLIIPVFALSNAGVSLSDVSTENLFNPISLGIFLGLFFGKQLGIFLFSYFAIKLKLANMLENVSYGKIYGAAILCGIGFTMSLFIANLAFESNALLNVSKIGILGGSLFSGIIGYFVLSKVLK